MLASRVRGVIITEEIILYEVIIRESEEWSQKQTAIRCDV